MTTLSAFYPVKSGIITDMRELDWRILNGYGMEFLLEMVFFIIIFVDPTASERNNP